MLKSHHALSLPRVILLRIDQRQRAGARWTARCSASSASPTSRTALAFVTRVGELAEAENHHPDVELRVGPRRPALADALGGTRSRTATARWPVGRASSPRRSGSSRRADVVARAEAADDAARRPGRAAPGQARGSSRRRQGASRRRARAKPSPAPPRPRGPRRRGRRAPPCGRRRTRPARRPRRSTPRARGARGGGRTRRARARAPGASPLRLW